MKTIKILILTILFPTFLMAQSATSPAASFFDKHLGEDGYTTVKITEKMFDLIASIELDLDDAEDQAAMDMVKSIKGIMGHSGCRHRVFGALLISQKKVGQKWTLLNGSAQVVAMAGLG